ncbi:2-aminoethanethiol dioxygenase [Cryptotermes secundus]|uniref:2-aminoethanethiol dioxygenase n=1 Tax=Cryptotermes secundus TaxID=105785 RepID=UPI000CD7ACBA|nr:2-aminoethanethiol dioxygenase [Cryptotermes secundus]
MLVCSVDVSVVDVDPWAIVGYVNMASLVERVVRQALRTFSQKQTTNVIFEENFAKLKALADQLTAADVNLNIHSLQATESGGCKPPVIYISVYEDSHVTVGIFIVKSGEKLPLHDHPHMYGILKVIAGTVKIQSYTTISNSSDIDSPSAGGRRLFPYTRTKTQIQCAIKMPEVIVNENNGACFLTPTERNLHEIYSVGAAAAFLDILSPPYDTSEFGERSCHYFKELNNETPEPVTNKARLIRIPSPAEYWNDVAVYEGPKISFANEQLE